MFISYFFSFVLTYLGFLLGKSTKEEHQEIGITIKLFSIIFKLAFYFLMFYVFWGSNLIYLNAVLLVLFLIGQHYKNLDIIRFSDVVLFAISFIYLYTYKIELMSIILILILAMLFDHSLKRFHLKEELYVIGIYLLTYVVFIFLNK